MHTVESGNSYGRLRMWMWRAVLRCREVCCGIWTVKHDLADGQVSVYAFVDCVCERYVMSVTGGVVGRKNSTSITIFLQQQR
jgi:hypothetical protein